MKIGKGIRKFFVWTLVGSILAGNLTPALAYTDSIENEEYHNHSEDTSSQTTVYAELGSEFVVTIPKAITLSGETKSGTYTVSVTGDIAGDEFISVIPDDSFILSSKNLASKTATISQDKTEWIYSEMLENNVIGNGKITADGITAGAWNGSFNFNIGLNTKRFDITAVDENGTSLNATGSYIIGQEKTDLIAELVESGNVQSADEVNLLLDVQSDSFEGTAITTFDVSNIASDGDIVAIYHYDETNGWEYIGTGIVINGTVTGSFNSFSPVALVIENATDHVHSYEESVSKSPTCTEAGIKTFTCRCGNSYTEEIEILEHNWQSEFTVDVNATCTEKGSKSIHCADCSATKDVTEIEALGHTYGQWEEVETPDCTNAGSKQRTCDVCGHVDTDSVSALGHSWEDDFTVDKKATCTVDGSKSIHCTECDAVKDSTVIPATGHTSVNGGTESVHTKCSTCGETLSSEHSYIKTVAKEATCTEKGTSKYTCECGYSYTAQDIEALGHNYEAVVTAPTCTDEGYTTHTCSRCNDSYVDSKVSATGHDYVSSVTKEATCTVAGNKHYECNNCDYAYDEVIDAIGHIYDITKYVTDTPATCTTAGSKSVHCNVCNAKITGTEVAISATGHNVVNDICTECGKNITELGGLFDANGVMLCTWEDSGINVATNYTSSTYKTNTASPYYVITNAYPTATKVVLPDSVTSIGYSAFEGCTGLTSVIIGSGVTSIGDQAFYNCTGLTNITIGSGVTSIGNYAFQNCTGLTSITIPDNVTSIGSQAFYNCTRLTSITIPDSVTSIGYSAFEGCTGLTSVIIGSGVTIIERGAFRGCTELTSIIIPDSVTSIGSQAFYNCTRLTSITIPDSVTSIGNLAFYECTGLTSIEIPDSVTSIGYSAFKGCSSVTEITIPSSVTNIGSNAFYNCTNLTSVTFEDTETWYVGSSAGATTTQIDVTDASTNATYLKSTYYNKYWTKK